MVTFNVDSLDFRDDEKSHFGATPDFGFGFDSVNTRIELDDLVNGTTSYVQQDRGGDLVDGRLSQAVAEGKVLSDDGGVYDNPSDAETDATSWIKLGPGTFDGTFWLNKNGLTVIGSGPKTIIHEGSTNGIRIDAQDVTIRNLSVRTDPDNGNHAINTTTGAERTTIENVTVPKSGKGGIHLDDGKNHLIKNCNVLNTGSHSIESNQPSTRIIGNKIKESGGNALLLYGNDSIIGMNRVIGAETDGCDNVAGSDSIIIANYIEGVGRDGISINTNTADCIVSNNQVWNCGDRDIHDQATGTVIDGNKTGLK